MLDEPIEESKVKIEPLPLRGEAKKKVGRPRKYPEGAEEHRKKTEDKITLTEKRKKALKKLHVMNSMRNEEKRRLKKERREKAEELLQKHENNESKVDIQNIEEKIQVESKKDQGKSNNADFYRSPIGDELNHNPSAVAYNTSVEIPDKIPIAQTDTLQTQPFGTKGKLKVEKVFMNEKQVINQRREELRKNNHVPYTDVQNEIGFLNGSNVFPSRKSGFETTTSTNRHHYVTHNQHPFSHNISNSSRWNHQPQHVEKRNESKSPPKLYYAYNPFHNFQ